MDGTMTIVYLTKHITVDQASAIIKWLRDNALHQFTGEGMSEVTFENAEDATLFKLLFDV